MYLKSDKELFRQRRSFRWVRVLIIVTIMGTGATFGYRTLVDFVEPFTPRVAPPPIPTPTTSAAFYVSQGEDAYWRG